MNCARNCGNLLNFVKVIPKTLLVPFFSGHGVVVDSKLPCFCCIYTRRTKDVVVSADSLLLVVADARRWHVRLQRAHRRQVPAPRHLHLRRLTPASITQHLGQAQRIIRK